MLELVYTKAPRRVSRVYFFGKGRFRRVRDGVLADDLEQTRDPYLVLETERVGAMSFMEDYDARPAKTVTRLTENGRQIAKATSIVMCTGKRRPDLKVYILR